MSIPAEQWADYPIQKRRNMIIGLPLEDVAGVEFVQNNTGADGTQIWDPVREEGEAHFGTGLGRNGKNFPGDGKLPYIPDSGSEDDEEEE